VRQKVKDSVTTEEMEGKRRLEQYNSGLKKQIEENRNRAVALNEKVQAEYSMETQRIEEEGTQDIQGRQNKFEASRREQEQANHDRLQQIQKDQFDREVRSRKEHEGRVNHTIKQLDDTMKQERQNFAKDFDREAQIQKDTLISHKETYLKELFKQKRDFDKRMGLEKSRGDDPFYRLKNFEAKIHEGSDHYELKARVAPHEKDSVDIIIKDDKIVLSARRSYQDANELDGIKTATNNYQTYRQEFALASPIDAKRVVKKVADDGTITAIIPKLPPRIQAKT
ncbi:MAG TPA: Hsp20 family protein, partial [Bdellovibrionales bacterium]|nr:Hsp20 family protein [Bdellovibrionales bacterium]